MGRRDDSSASADVDIESNRRKGRKKPSKASRRNREPSDGNLSEVSSRDEPIGDQRTGVNSSASTTDDKTNSSEVESRLQKKNGKSGTLMTRLIRVAICFLLLLAILFLIFTALSTPVIKPLYFFSLSDKDDSGDRFTFGIWGYCWPAIKINIDGGSSQAYDEGCRGAMVGWTLANVPGLADESDSVKHALTGALLINVLVIVILILAFLASAAGAAVPDMLVSKSGSRSSSSSDASSISVDNGSAQSSNSDGNTRKRKREEENDIEPNSTTSEGPSQDQISSGRRRMSALVAIGAVFALFFMIVVFFFDLGALLQIRHNVDNASGLEFDFGWGPAFWFVVAAFVIVILACFLAFVDMFLTVAKNPKSTDKKKESSDDIEGANSQSESRSGSMSASMSRYEERKEKESGARRPAKTTRTDSTDSEAQMVDIDLNSDSETRRPRANRSKTDKSRRKKRA